MGESQPNNHSDGQTSQQQATKDAQDVLKHPIPGPEPAGPEWVADMGKNRPLTPVLIVGRFLADLIRDPARWLREKVVESNRGPEYYYYHRKYRRALPVDECYLDDKACLMEATYEYRRNFAVDQATLDILRMRLNFCRSWGNTKVGGQGWQQQECDGMEETYKREETNFFIKYGDLQYRHGVLHAFNKQKHRMIMERRQAKQREAGEAPPEPNQ